MKSGCFRGAKGAIQPQIRSSVSIQRASSASSSASRYRGTFPNFFTVTGTLACRSAPALRAAELRRPATCRPRRHRRTANGGRRFPAANPGRGLDGGHGPHEVPTAVARQEGHRPAALVPVNDHPARVDRMSGHDFA